MSEQNTLSTSELQQQASKRNLRQERGDSEVCVFVYGLQKAKDYDDTERAFELLKESAKSYCGEAQFLMGHRDLQSDNALQNDALVFEWLKKAAEQNCVEAQYLLSDCYLQSKGVEHNNALAFEWLNKAVEQNYDKAQYGLAYCYLTGGIVEQNEALAFAWFKSAFEQQKQQEPQKQQAEFLYWLACCSFEGNNVEQNETLAFECFKKTAGQGITEVEYRLAHCYFEGKGVEKNYELGMRWIIRAARKGHVGANNWLNNAYISLAIPSCLSDKEDAEQYYKFAADWCLKKVDGHNAAEANLLLGVLYSSGKGVEQSDELALDCFKKADEAIMRVANGEDYQSIQSFIDCYLLCSESRYERLSHSFYDVVGDAFVEGILKVTYRENPNHKVFLTLLRAAIYKKAGEYGLAKDCIKESFDKDEYMDKNLRDICLSDIEQEQEIAEKNQELEAKNKQLQEAQKELEDMMSMFAHKFRNPLDAIIYNTTHENQVKLYTEAAQTMRGLLNIFSIISTDAEILKDKIKQDCLGNGRLAGVFSKTLDMILLHLLSVSGAEKIQQHYMAYAKSHGQCDAEVGYKTWCEDYFELEQALQSEWEQSFALLLNQSATLEQRFAWLEQHFFKLKLIGFERVDIQFKEYGVTESFLTILLNEILVNAFKYYSSASKQPVVLEWTEREGYQVLICHNPSVRSERTIIKGSHKGQAFLSTLARKTGSAFTKPTLQDDFVVEFGIPDELLISK